jgi:mono/diheme cytochrome c family protein
MRRIGGVFAVAMFAGSVAIACLLPAGGQPARAESETPATNPLSGNEAAVREGRSWFRAVCSPCHGGRADGAGERGQGADLRVFNKGFKKFVDTVKNGRDVPGRIQKMPPWGAVLSEKQIYQIGAYLETLALQGANWKDGVTN